MPSHTVAEPGALTGLTLTEEEKERGVVAYPVFGQKSVKPEMDLSNLQNVYGTAAMPSFRFVQSIQTGVRKYDPEKDKPALDKYKELVKDKGVPPGMMSPEEIEKMAVAGAVSQVGQFVGRSVGRAVADPYLEGSFGTKAMEGVTSAFSGTPLDQVTDAIDVGQALKLGSTEIFQPEIANAKVATATGNTEVFEALKSARVTGAKGDWTGAYDTSKLPAGYSVKNGKLQAPNNVASKLTAETIAQGSATPTYLEKVGGRLYGTPQAASNWSSAAAGGIVNFGVQLAMGEDPVKAAKSAGASAIGTALGNAILPGIGGLIGGALGGLVGGRVICNELMKQGLMTREQVLLDYRFTRDYLTPRHVNGYHCWAVWMVKQMRKGKFVKFWKHVAGHRANEIAYIYGKRDKPDYLGKLYRHLLEPTCWVIGSFKKESDWSPLYKEI